MYAKIFGSILDSSVMDEDIEVRWLWIVLLVMANQDGVVVATEKALAHRARLTLEQTRKGLQVLTTEDVESKDQDFGGRRVEKVEGGFLVLNYGKYRNIRTRAQELAAERQRRQRERKATQKPVDSHPNSVTERDVTPRHAASRRVTTIASASASASASESVSEKRTDLSESKQGRLRSMFENAIHAEAYDGYIGSARMPDGVDGILRMVLGDLWTADELGEAMVRMRSAGADFSRRTLIGFARAVREDRKQVQVEQGLDGGALSATSRGALEIIAKRRSSGGGE